MVIDGRAIAKEIIEGLRIKPGPDKFLAAVLVGNDPSSLSFLRQKEKVAKDLGVDFRIYELCDDSPPKGEASYTTDTLRKEVGRIAGQKTVGGIIVQLPLPKKFNEQYILNAIPVEKDVDILGERALGAFYAGRGRVLPPAVGTLKNILEEQSFDLSDKKVGVVGLGFLVGKPISVWLMGKAKDVILFDSKSDLNGLREMDLVISGVGKGSLIKKEMIKAGVGIVDFGYDFVDGKICGDVDLENIKDIARFITPTPGGTGPILVAKLFENFYELSA